MTRTVPTRANDQDGYVLIAVLLMLVLLTVIGLAASGTSQTEMQIAGNVRHIAADLYTAEGVLTDHLEKSTTWLTNDFIAAGETAANYVETVDLDEDDQPDGTVEIRCIEISGAKIAGLSAAANNLPKQEHIAPPPPAAGSSMDKFEARRYGLTTTSGNQTRVVQTGVWKLFNSFQ